MIWCFVPRPPPGNAVLNVVNVPRYRLDFARLGQEPSLAVEIARLGWVNDWVDEQ